MSEEEWRKFIDKTNEKQPKLRVIKGPRALRVLNGGRDRRQKPDPPLEIDGIKLEPPFWLLKPAGQPSRDDLPSDTKEPA